MQDDTLKWSILGVGQAGHHRVKAIQNDSRSELVGVCRGRYAPRSGAQVFGTPLEAIRRADAVYVCSPIEEHEKQIRMALEADKHVATEYPLALDVDVAQDLFRLAITRKRILHVGHIELLSGVARTLSAHLTPRDVRRVDLSFATGGPPLEGPALAFRNVARLHRLLAVAGPVLAIKHVHHGAGELLASVELRTGGSANLAFRQAPNLRRHTVMEVLTSRGRWQQVNRDLYLEGNETTVLDPGPVFEADHRFVTARILDESENYVSEERIIAVLALAAALRDGTRGPV